MTARARARVLALVILGLGVPLARGAEETPGSSAARRFREATELIRARDFPKGLALYQEIAASGAESASLYWNWAQAASARGARGEALWALLRGREIEPGDRALPREIERLREALNLDPAEIAPEPLGVLARFGRRFHLAFLAVVLLGGSVLLRGASRLPTLGPWPSRLAAATFVLGAIAAALAWGATLARPTATVIHRGAPLTDAASPTAQATGSLREGEVVPILEASGGYLRIEDSAGARGWARAEDLRRLDQPPER